MAIYELLCIPLDSCRRKDVLTSYTVEYIPHFYCWPVTFQAPSSRDNLTVRASVYHGRLQSKFRPRCRKRGNKLKQVYRCRVCIRTTVIYEACILKSTNINQKRLIDTKIISVSILSFVSNFRSYNIILAENVAATK